MHPRFRHLAAFLLGTLAACGGQAGSTDSARADSVARARQDSINRAQPGYIVDSILPVEEELRRFRADLGDAPTALSGGASSREALVRRFTHALETSDTTALIRMAVSRAEYAWLVYPESPFTRPPYRQPPGLAWMQLMSSSGSGLARLLARKAGRPVGEPSVSCGSESLEGMNRTWRDCVVTVRASDGQTTRARWFGAIIERGGHVKFLSFANDF